MYAKRVPSDGLTVDGVVSGRALDENDTDVSERAMRIL